MGLTRKNLTRIFAAIPLFIFVMAAQAMIWAESYNSMIERSEIIFIGTLSETRTYRLKETIYPYRSEPQRAKEVEGLYTDHVFTVERILKGDYPESTIAISQFGGFDGGYVNGSPQMLYFLSMGKRYLIISVHSEITPSLWVSANYGMGVLEVFDKQGKSYLKSVSKTKGVKKHGDPGSKTEGEVSLEAFIKIIDEFTK